MLKSNAKLLTGGGEHTASPRALRVTVAVAVTVEVTVTVAVTVEVTVTVAVAVSHR